MDTPAGSSHRRCPGQGCALQTPSLCRASPRKDGIVQRNKSGIFQVIPTNQTHNSCFNFWRFVKPGLGFPGIQHIQCPVPNHSPLSCSGDPKTSTPVPASHTRAGTAPSFGSSCCSSRVILGFTTEGSQRTLCHGSTSPRKSRNSPRGMWGARREFGSIQK